MKIGYGVVLLAIFSPAPLYTTDTVDVSTLFGGGKLNKLFLKIGADSYHSFAD
jgi:hypothetical protein